MMQSSYQQAIASIDATALSGRNRRLYNEWVVVDKRLQHRTDITYSVEKFNAAGVPVQYHVTYHIKSICGVEQVEQLHQAGVLNKPLFASQFEMRIVIPPNYPCIDAQPAFMFLTHNQDNLPIAHPWHPNIRYFGEFAGRVCLNAPDSYMDIAWYIERIALYLRYELYHALPEPPYPEDMTVAKWVIKQGETNNWIYFNQEER